MSYTTTWTVTVQVTEEGDLTTAHATVDTGPRTLRGAGQAHRNSADVDLPEIGDELAVGRALRDLSDRLLLAAEADIEEVEERPVHVDPAPAP